MILLAAKQGTGMKLRDKNNSYYERRVVFMKNIIINNIDKITIGIGIFSISGLLYVVKELSKYDC